MPNSATSHAADWEPWFDENLEEQAMPTVDDQDDASLARVATELRPWAYFVVGMLAVWTIVLFVVIP